MTDEWINPFLDALARTGVYARAARMVGVPYGTMMRRKAVDEDFSAAVDEAMKEAVDGAEAELWRRAVSGVEEPIVHQGGFTYLLQRDERGHPVIDEEGRPVYELDDEGRPKIATTRKYSDSLLALLLKGRRKDVFSERQEITGADGGPVQLDEGTRAARIAQIMAVARGRADLDDLA